MSTAELKLHHQAQYWRKITDRPVVLLGKAGVSFITVLLHESSLLNLIYTYTQSSTSALTSSKEDKIKQYTGLKHSKDKNPL